jgi:hypothetical protein
MDAGVSSQCEQAYLDSGYLPANSTVTRTFDVPWGPSQQSSRSDVSGTYTAAISTDHLQGVVVDAASADNALVGCLRARTNCCAGLCCLDIAGDDPALGCPVSPCSGSAGSCGICTALRLQ